VFGALAASDPQDDIAADLPLPHALTVDAWLVKDALSVRWSGQRGGQAVGLAQAHRREVQRLLDSLAPASAGAAPTAAEMQSLFDELSWTD
jgi:hypothetical protein